MDTHTRCLGVAGNWRGVGVGGHLTWIRWEPQEIRTIYEPEGTGEYATGNKEYFGLFGVGLDLRHVLPNLSGSVEWGAGLGLAYYQDPFAGAKEDGFDMDFGTLCIWTYPLGQDLMQTIDGSSILRLRGGYAVRNIWDNGIDRSGAEVRFGRRDYLGLAAELSMLEYEDIGHLAQFTVAYDHRALLLHAYDGEEGTDHLGMELRLAGLLSLRAGRVFYGEELGHQDRQGLGLGLHPGNPYIPWLGFAFDYARLEGLGFDHIDQLSFSMSLAEERDQTW